MSIYEECQLLAKGNVDDSTLQKLTVRFIRGQDEIAIYQGRGNGRILSAWEAYKTFLPKIFEEILESGTAVLSISSAEPSSTLKKQRQMLSISQEELANKAKLSIEDVIKAESDQYESDFSVISKLCKIMNIDDYSISYQSNNASNQLAYRLKKTFDGGDIKYEDILRMTECGWIADKQILLQTWINEYHPFSPKKNYEYGSIEYPAYKIGYELAQRTRQLLNIAPSEKIPSMRDLLRKIDIPYILTELSSAIAGATVATNNSRCIIANINGKNENPLIRRITIAHELAHLLWDSDEHLQSVNVSLYDNFDTLYNNDIYFIEQRANAFAVEFLMPSMYIENKKNNEKLIDYIRRIMVTYGTSFTSTKYHLYRNHKITSKDLQFLEKSPERVQTEASDEWKAKEDFTLDYFPITSTPINKRGFFAYWVCKALKAQLITEDSASNFLDCSKDDIIQQSETILNLF